jgi:glycosyltransferase involved in cell wall biosynthesis
MDSKAQSKLAIGESRSLERRRILHVSSAHRASDGRIAQKQAKTLAAAGYAVTVLALERAAGVALPAGPIFVEYAPPASRIRRFLLRLPWLLAYCIRHRFDAYHLHDPDLILVGIALKLLGRRVIYDVHESYPMVVLDRAWIPRMLRPMLSRAWQTLESAFVRWADLTVTAHDPVREQFRGGNVVTVQNFPIPGDWASMTGAQPMAERPHRVLYHGDITAQRGLFTMLQAIAAVDAVPSPVLRLGGSLSLPLQEAIKHAPGFRRTEYLGWLNKDQLAAELSEARAGLILLHPTHNYNVIRPNKLYEYMAAGLPVIASDFNHWREVVAEERCGLLVDPLNSTAIARAIEYIFSHADEAAAMGERGRRAVAERYSWASEGETLLGAYGRLFRTPTLSAVRMGRSSAQK